jgi:hypothetical protein
MKMCDLLHVLAALPLVQESQHPMNKKMYVSTADLDALGMMLMVNNNNNNNNNNGEHDHRNINTAC